MKHEEQHVGRRDVLECVSRTGDRLIWLVAHFPNLQRLDASG